MPIVVPVEKDAPLSQGDILSGVKLYITSSSSEFSPQLGSHYMGLVISRPCSTINKRRIVVAAIEPFKFQLEKEAGNDLSHLLRILTEVRDADGSDSFYLGNIPGLSGRYQARLDFLSTLEVPHESEARAQWIERVRTATLHIDFRRDLHTRLFLAVAKQGFEDLEWISDADLELVVNCGAAQLSHAQTAVHEAIAELAKADATGHLNQRREGLEKKRRSAEEALAKLERIVSPYSDELSRRRG